jgi:hypothetical protein
VSDKKITLGAAIDQIVAALELLEERSRLTAIHAACEFLSLKTASLETVGKSISHQDKGIENVVQTPLLQQTNDNATDKHQIDIRKFKEEKRPKSARQMACVVAYYLQELAPPNERKDTISVEDLEKYFKQAKYQLPEKIAQVLVAAKGAGYLDSKERGQYKLNAVGYNLVAHNLPADSDA